MFINTVGQCLRLLLSTLEVVWSAQTLGELRNAPGKRLRDTIKFGLHICLKFGEPFVIHN